MVLKKEKAILKKLLTSLKKQRIALISHSTPDFDAAASLIALHSILPKSVIYLDNPRKEVQLLFSSMKLSYKKSKPPESYQIIVVDTNSRNLSNVEKALLVIDHHETDKFKIEAQHSIICPFYSSCSELIYDLIGHLLKKDALFALCLGIASDTVLFKVASSETISKFALMLKKSGRNMEDVIRFLSSDISSENKPLILEAIKSTSWILINNISIAFAITKVNPSKVAEILSNISDLVFVAEVLEKGTKISARSRGIKGIELNSIMATLAERCKGYGGGHINAAGAFVQVSPNDAFHQLLLMLEPIIPKKKQRKK